MIKVQLHNIPNNCSDFLALGLDWEYVFNTASKVSREARERRRQRGVGQYPKLRRYVRIKAFDGDLLQLEAQLNDCIDIVTWEFEQPDEPLYNPTDPEGLNYAWTKQTLTHATDTTAFDVEKGDSIVIGIIESSGNGANYTDAELGGTGNHTTDWAAIQAGTHAKFVDYTNPGGTSIDPYGTSHGNTTSRQAIAVMDNAFAYCGSCPNGKIMMAVGQDFDEAIQRMADLGVDVISVSYNNCAVHRTAIQYAITSGTIVIYAHNDNSHSFSPIPRAFEAITVGGFNLSDESDRSYGEGLTVVSRGPSGSAESWGTPSVAGIIGLLLARNPTWNIADVWSALIHTCQKPAEMEEDWDIEYGFGIPDAYAALQMDLVDLSPLPVFKLLDGIIYIVTFGIQLTWAHLPTTNFVYFKVRRKEDEIPQDENDGTLIYSGSELSYYDIPPSSGDWFYGIWSIDSEGNRSYYSTNSDYYTHGKDFWGEIFTKVIPEISAITSTYESITLQWDTVSDADGYRVYWDTNSGTPYANSTDIGDVLEYTIIGLTPGTRYYVSMTAYDSESRESDYSDEETIAANNLSRPIVTLTDTETTITVTWDAVVPLAAGYTLFWDADSGEPYANEVDVGDVLTYTIPGLTEGQQYYVTIQAYLSEIEVSELAVEVSTITGPPSSLSFVGATFEHGIAHFVLPTNVDVDYAGVTIKNVTRNKIITSEHILPDYFDTQASIDDIFEVWGTDTSGNIGTKWNIIINRYALTINEKGS